jgi:hypothetical protein
MFDFLRRRKHHTATPSINSLRFEISDLHLERVEPYRLIWTSRSGDAISLYFFPKPPDLPRGLSTSDELRTSYAKSLEASPIKLVEAQIITAGACRIARVIVKDPMEPSGMIYVGSLIIPFRDFSYVIKAECPEHGTTGVREAILTAVQLRAGEDVIDADGKLRGDLNFDDERYDAQFPHHPLSRLRALLRAWESTLVIEPAVLANNPPFIVPQ